MAEWPTIPEGYGYPLVNMESRRLPDSVMEAIADSQELDDKITERIGEGGGEVVATPDATTTVKGKIRLAGDLAGTADAPTVPGLAQKLAIADAPELIRDIVASALVAGANVTITPNDEGDTITIGLSLGSAAQADVEDFAAATHTHAQSDVTGLVAALGAKADASSLGTAAASDVEDFAAAEHGHGISDVTGLQDALDGKASTSHTHTPSSIGAANAEHTHDIADVDGLQTALDGKQAADSDLSAIAALSSTGFVVRTGSGTAAARSIAGSGAVQVSNGNGASGNPTISVDAASTSAAGIVELATAAEAVDGSDTQRAVTPAGLAAKFIIDPVDESAYPDGTIFLYTE